MSVPELRNALFSLVSTDPGFFFQYPFALTPFSDFSNRRINAEEAWDRTYGIGRSDSGDWSLLQGFHCSLVLAVLQTQVPYSSGLLYRDI